MEHIIIFFKSLTRDIQWQMQVTSDWYGITLPAERGWVSENLARSPRRSRGLRGMFSLTHLSSAGIFIFFGSICVKVFHDQLSTMVVRFH